MATGLGLRDKGKRSSIAGKGKVLFFAVISIEYNFLKPTQQAIQWAPRTLSPGVK